MWWTRRRSSRSGIGKILGRQEISAKLSGAAGEPQLLLLLGCSAADVSENFQPYPECFRDAGVSIVLAPVAPIRGKDAVPIAKQLAERLAERLAESEPTSFGEIMPLLRRELLLAGHPGVMGIVGFGDGDWLLGGQMMLKLQMLPAACGDCLWLEYGTGTAKRVVIIDGGLTETATALRQRIETARLERGIDTLEVELLVVTHIDNDHILGIIELLKAETPGLRVKDIWFNGRPQLDGSARSTSSGGRSGGGRQRTSAAPADLMGGATMRTTMTKRPRRPRSRRVAVSAQTSSDRSRATSCRSCLPPAACPGTSTPSGTVGR